MKHAVRAIFCALFLLLINNFNVAAQTVKPFVTVDAARYQPAVAPDSIVSGFTLDITTQQAWATEDVDSLTPGIQLPTTLAGLRVLVNNRLAGLLYVGPNQINYIVPSATELDGPATVVVTNEQGTTLAQGELYMAASSLNIFTHNQQGTGSPAAAFTADGITYSQVNNGDGSTNEVPPGNYLVLFATGVRSSSEVKAFIGGIEAQVDYAGEQPSFVALDQINIRVPESVTGQGWLNVVLSDGLTMSNIVRINVGGNPQAPSGAPVITSLGAAEAVAGQVITLTGSQFPTVLSEASVRIGTTPGQVLSTSATSMSFVVPYGVATDNVYVGNINGVRQSTGTLNIRTSISGTVLDASDAPVAGIPVSVSGGGLTTTTDGSGRFLLTDVPNGIAQVDVDTSLLPANLGLPNLTFSLVVATGRDNEIGYPIYLPTNSGSNIFLNSARATGYGFEAAAEADPVVLQHDGLKLEIPGIITFPKGAKEPRLGLTRLAADGRLPTPLPRGVYPSVVALITPIGTTFGAKGEGQATLTFPNPDGFPAGATLDLYAFRSNVAPSSFVKKGTATVDSTGQKIIAQGVIDFATIWFVGLPSDQVTFTNVTGALVDNNDKPVAKARVFVRGRSAVTDKEGKFEIKGVRAKNNDELRVEAMFYTPAGNQLKTFKLINAVVPGTTNAGTLQLPAPPALSLLIRPHEVKTRPGVAMEMKLVLSRKLSAPATINLMKEDGVALTITPETLNLQAGQTEATFTVKGGTPGRGTVVAKLAAAVDDVTPETTRKGFAIVYVLNPPPQLEALRPASGEPSSAFSLTGTGLGAEAQQNAVFFKQSDRVMQVDPRTIKVQAALETSGASTLSGIVPGLRTGEAEVFVIVRRDGVPSETSNQLKFTVNAAAAPKLTSLTPQSGKPGAAFTLVGTGLDPNPRNNGIFFKLGDTIFPASPEMMKVMVPTASDPNGAITIQGVVPRMPAGDAAVFAVVFRNGAPSDKSNLLPFKVEAPAAAKLESIAPTEGHPGVKFSIKGSNFDPDGRRNFVFFKKGEIVFQLDPSHIQYDGQTMLSGIVPRTMPGDYQVFVVTNLESVVVEKGQIPGTASNALPFKVLPPPGAQLASINPVEGLPGTSFAIKGGGWGPDVKGLRVVFRQSDKFIMLDTLSLKVDETTISGRVPVVSPGEYEIIVLTNLDLMPGTAAMPGGTPSNGLKFKVLAPPAPVIETINPTEGQSNTPFKITGKNFHSRAKVIFKQGDKVVYVPTEGLRITETTIEGMLPAMPAGGAEVAVWANEQTSNPVGFKFLAPPPPPPAKLEALSPGEAAPGAVLTIKGTGFDPDPKRNVIVLKQGDRTRTFDPQLNRIAEGSLSGIVPEIEPGAYEVFVINNPTATALISNPPSNLLPFKVLPSPAPVLTAIDPVEGVPGKPFKITGKNLDHRARLIFRQGDHNRDVPEGSIKITPTSIEGMIPGGMPGDAEVFLSYWENGQEKKSNILKFKFLPVPNVARLGAINPTDVVPAKPFRITGVNLAPFYVVVFEQNQKYYVVPEHLTKFTDGAVEGIVPGLAPGPAEVFVAFGDEINHVASNKLTVKVLEGQRPVLENITPTAAEPGATFIISGQHLAPVYSVIFKRGTQIWYLRSDTLVFENGTIRGKVPYADAGDAEVYLILHEEEPYSNKLPFKITAKTP